jgi:(p)ppGpp synthase/HD superfamily hydrolase
MILRSQAGRDRPRAREGAIMVLGSDRPGGVEGVADAEVAPEVDGRLVRSAPEQQSSLVRSALVFAVRSHARQRRRSDGAAFIEHPLEVAGLLHDVGCSDVVVAAGLLHDVVEDCHVSVAELTWRFGAEVAHLVRTVTEDATVDDYRHRKRMLREQVRTTGGDAALVFAADKIAKVCELPELVRRERACRAEDQPGRARNPLDDDHRLRLEHYRRSLRMLQRVAPAHPLVKRLASDLDYCPTAIRRALSEDEQ